ncbi:cyclic nucleotide-binding protein, putative [Bodo saltans]|uniref:Cyclic nucleotide-binding protein, putative n=1 Tax=Bodo saltans TaxID=75058 RepID=A0A0S4IM01_BODSA|nr:cyclic nucleotide-binding protein, putative [Bodo saltans]|eukprot:CUF34979.1 cyclic nucleotide-binding protein, putative [Bodo saltans]
MATTIALLDGVDDALATSATSRSERRKSQTTFGAVGEGSVTAASMSVLSNTNNDGEEEDSFVMFDSPAGMSPRNGGNGTDAGNTKPMKRATYSLMLVAAKGVTQLFAPVLQHPPPNAQRRRSSVSMSMVSSLSSRPVLDSYLYTVNLAKCHPAFQHLFENTLTPKAPPAGGAIKLPKAMGGQSGGGASSKLDWSVRGGGGGALDGSFLSGSSEGEKTPSVLSPRSGGAPATFMATGNYFDPNETEDPFERDVFSQETRRIYHACKAADEKLDSLLSPFRQSLLRQQTELQQTPDRKLFGSNVKFVLAAKMWEVLFSVVRFAQRAQAQYAEELFTQRVVRQMAPLCAIKLRQRLKRTRIAVALPTIARPTIEVFKADRTFSHFPEEQLEGLRSRMTLLCFFRHEALLYRGAQDDQCYLIERGMAETRDGLTALQVFRRNHVVGALGMMVGEPRIHSVVASTEVLAWVIKKQDFEETLNHADAKTKNALIIVNEQRQRNIRDVYHEQLLPSSLRQYLLFTGVRDTVLETAVAESQPRVFRRGDVIFKGGDPATSALCVIRGRVRLSVVAQKPLSNTKTLQQHVAEAVCMQQSRRKTNAPTAASSQGKSTQGNHLFIMREERPLSSLSLPSPSRNGHSRGGARYPGRDNTSGDNASSQLLDATDADVGRRGHSPHSLAASPSPGAGSEGPSEFHSNGMACDIACPVLISLPHAVEQSNHLTDIAMEKRLRMLHAMRENGDASVALLPGAGAGGVDDDDDHDDGNNVTHMFTVTVLSETIDCLLLSGDKLRALLRTDRETTNAFSYNLTCLALPFIKPLPRSQLLKTLFPPAFAFGFLPKLPLHTLTQTPIVFAPNDIITTDDVEQGDGACVVIVYKGELQRSDAAKLCAPSTPYMWPEISFGCTQGAKAMTRALTSIEGVLIRRSELMHLVQTSLRGNDRTVLLESLKAHFALRVGRRIPGVTSAMHGGGDMIPAAAAGGGAATTTHESHAGDRRIRAALFGASDEELKREASMNLLGPRGKSTRINPLIRAELNAIHLPKYPDRTCTIQDAMDKKQRNMNLRDSAGISQCAVITGEMNLGQQQQDLFFSPPQSPKSKVSLHAWVTQAKSAVSEHIHETGCLDPQYSSPLLLLDREPLESLHSAVTSASRAPAMIAATLVKPLQHAFFIETGATTSAINSSPVSARGVVQRHPAPPPPYAPGAASYSGAMSARSPHNNGILKSLLPPSALQRRQAEILRSLQPPRQVSQKHNVAAEGTEQPVFEPTCASTRRARDEHRRRDRL